LKHIPQKYLVFFGLIAVVVVVIFVFVGFSVSDIPDNPVPLYIDLSNNNQLETEGPININDIEPNSVHYFYYPRPEDPINRDVYERFMLIRLPAILGGNNDDVSAFRAYSAIDPGSSCLIKYWPQDGRQRIEDPCKSPSYRAIDGISESWVGGKFFVGKPSTGALPKLDLIEDQSGYLYILPPIFSPDKNGSIGLGRDVSQQEFDAGTEFMNKMQKNYDQKMSSFNLPSSLSTGHVLSKVEGEYGKKYATYVIPGQPENSMSIEYEFCNCTRTYDKFSIDYGKLPVKNFWRVGNADIYAVAGNVNLVEKTSSLYKFSFYGDGFRVDFRTTLPFDEGMTLVLENYFSVYTLDDVTKIKD